MEWDDFRRVLEGATLPAALVDLDALAFNVSVFRRALEGKGKTLRVATKSVRHTGLLRRILSEGGPTFRGLMCYSAREAAWLSTSCFDDLFVAYPSVQASGLREVAEAVRGGATIRMAVDHNAHLEALEAAGRAAGVVLDAIVDVDVSMRMFSGRAHVGVRRSSLRDAEAARRFARSARPLEHVRLVGLMGYEAHIAGLSDRPEGGPPPLAIRALKRAAMPRVVSQRAAMTQALLDEGIELTLVNGGGTGSVHDSLRDAALTEVTVGSGFLCSHLFDGYDSLALEPAAFFALEVGRVPDRDHICCSFGGYVASGSVGRDRLPQPYLPRGLAYVDLEGAGEVQTPLRIAGAQRAPRAGDPVIFRHAKAGELAEHFSEYILLHTGQIVGREPTYRGEGVAFG